MKFRNISKYRNIEISKYRVAVFLLILFVGGFFLFYTQHSFEIEISKYRNIELSNFGAGETLSLSGGKALFTYETCKGATRRPIAVMLAGDPEARPLSGIGSADMVIEMPVVANGITRYLAFYQCNEPIQIGSVRSARAPFIGLAKGYGAVFAHWGGEKDALAKLRKGIIDNIDALPNPANAFWRKRGVPAPHDGFTSFSRLEKAAEKLTYDLRLTTNDFFTFKNNLLQAANNIITIAYPGKFQVAYHYKPETNSYFRFKGGTPEIDVLTKKQVEAKNVVILWAKVYPTYSQYDNVELDGNEGRLRTFIGGKDIPGRWSKEAFDTPLLFFDTEGKPLELEPGTIWVQVIGLEQEIEVTKL